MTSLFLLNNPLSLTSFIQLPASVASFGLTLRDSKYLGDYDMNKLIGLAKSGLGEDDGGYRAEFVRLMKTAQELSLQKPAAKAE